MTARPNRAASPLASSPQAGDERPKSTSSASGSDAWPWQPTWRVLTDDGLEHIEKHKYKSGVYTPLDDLLNPMWLYLTDLLPMWFAPNLVTMCGFIPLCFTFVLTWWVSPTYDTPAPRWLALLNGTSLWAYQTLDAMDGKQARRTKSSSPLGQLFDHGCDCMACLCLHSATCMVGLPGGGRSVVYCLTYTQTAFFFAQWQERYTGVLSTSFGPIGVTESQYLMILVCLLAAIVGPDSVGSIMNYGVPGLQWWWGEPTMPFGTICIQLWVSFVFVLMALSAWTTLPAAKSAGKLQESFVYLLPVGVLNVFLTTWNPESFAKEPRVICMAAGMVFVYLTVQLIVFTMARMPFPVMQPTVLPIIIFSIMSNIPSVYSVYKISLELYIVFVILDMSLWLHQVGKELKQKLKICVFTIPVIKAD